MKIKFLAKAKVVFFKIILWIFIAVVAIFALLFIALQFPQVQKFLTNKATSFVENKIHTKVDIKAIKLAFPKAIWLQGIYVEDQEKDTLLYCHSLKVDVDMLALMSKEIQINNVKIDQMTAHVHKYLADSVANYQFIIDGFQDTTKVKTPDPDKEPWSFSIYGLQIDGSKLKYEDQFIGMKAAMQIGHFDLDLDDFDLTKMIFEIDDFVLQNTTGFYTQSKKTIINPEPSEDSASDAQSIPDISFNDIRFSNVDLRYDDLVKGRSAHAMLGETIIDADEIDLVANRIILNDIILSNSNLSYQQNDIFQDSLMVAKADTSKTKSDSLSLDFGWIVEVEDIEIDTLQAKYDDNRKNATTSKLDYNHLDIADLHLTIEDVSLDKKGAGLSIIDFKFSEQSGLVLNQLAGKINITENEASIDKFVLKTNRSNLELDASAKYESLQMLTNKLAEASFNANVHKTRIVLGDVRYIFPIETDSLPLKLGDNFAVKFAANVSGKISDLKINELLVGFMDDTEFSSKGTVAGLPNIDQLTVDLNNHLTTTREDINNLLSDSLQQNIQAPEQLELTLDAKGSMSKLLANMNLQTSYGAILAKADLQNIRSDTPGYDGQITIEQFQLGQLLNDTSAMGIVDMVVKAQGSGFKPEFMDNSVKITINQFDYKHYTYNDLVIDGQFRNQILEIASTFDDENLAFELDGKLGMAEVVKKYDFTLNLKKVYFQNLNLMREDLRLKAKFDVDLTFDNIKNINGNFDISNLAAFKNGSIFQVDSFLVASVNEENKSSLNIDSEIMTVEFKGNVSIFDLPATLRQHFKSYYDKNETDTSLIKAQNFEFLIDIKNTDLITEVLLPQIDTFEPGEIRGAFDSKKRELDVLLQVPEITYNKFMIDSMVMSLQSDPENLSYSFGIAHIHDSIFVINQLSITGQAEDGHLTAHLQMNDTASQAKYKIGGELGKQGDNWIFSFFPDELMLNYDEWSLSDAHSLHFGDSGFVAENFSLKHGEQQLTITSKNKNLQVDFSDFHLATLSALVEGKDSIARGTLNGKFEMLNKNGFMALAANLDIQDTKYMNDAIGDVEIALTNEQQNKYDIILNLSGNDNDLKLNGYYAKENETPKIEADIKIGKLQLASIEALSGNAIKDAEGYLSGNAKISGPTNSLDISGKIDFNTTEFEVGYLGTRLGIDDQTINIANDKVNLDDFVLTDVDDNKFNINGSVDIGNFANPLIDLNIVASKFMLLNTTNEDNEMYYGKLILNSKADINGPIKGLDIGLSVNVLEGSRLTYVVPKASSEVLEREGILRFVDKDITNEEAEFFKDIKGNEPADTLKAPLGMTLNAIIRVDKKSDFSILIDPAAGDKLSISGDADLSLGINQAGDISLTGQYIVEEGQYNLSFYGVVRREFDVEKGSKLTWMGDVLNANIDLTALYNIETAPLDLMASQATESAQSNMYKQKLPFIVRLNMKGELLKPEISFTLDMKDDAKSYAGGAVYGKIQTINQEASEVNKQVFALLILKRFMANNPFASSGGSTEGMVRGSVSKILTDQLNSLTDQIDGLDIDVGLKSYEDYSTGERQGRTDLNLGVSTNLFDDRVTVKVAGNINLEGAEQKQNNLSDFAGDISVEYKLSEDGRFRIVTFRKEVYEALLQGEIIETGAGFIVIKDFDKFNEIFKKNEEIEDVE